VETQVGWVSAKPLGETLHAIGRMGRPTYTRTTDRFDMPRPR